MTYPNRLRVKPRKFLRHSHHMFRYYFSRVQTENDVAQTFLINDRLILDPSYIIRSIVIIFSTIGGAFENALFLICNI